MDFLSVTNHIKKLVKKYPRSGYKTKDLEFADVKIAPTMSLKPSSNLSQTTMMVNFYVKGLTELQKLQLGLLHHILTGNFMSILFNELRVKRGLCYSVESDNILIKTTSTTNKDTRYNGIIFIKIDADPTKIKECLKLILQFILTRKIKNSQFLNSKKSLDNTISFSFQTSKDYLYYYGNMFLNNETTEPSKLTKVLKNTTLSNINNLLDIIKKGDLYVNMIGEFIK